MELKLVNEYKDKNSDYNSKEYRTNKTVQQNNFCDLLESLENDESKFFICLCNSYNESGSPLFRRFYSINELRKEDFYNPSVSFNARFVDSKSDEYRFSVSSSINSDIIDIEYDPEMVDITKKDVEQRKMFEEYIKKKAEEEKQNSEGGYTK